MTDVRARVREILDPFMARYIFEEPPGATDNEIAEVCDRLRVDLLPAAVDEFLRVCGGQSGPAQELFPGESPLDVTELGTYGRHSMKVLAKDGVPSDLLEDAVLYSQTDSAIQWLRPSSSVLEGDLEVWWSLEDGTFGRADHTFLEDLAMRVEWESDPLPRTWPPPPRPDRIRDIEKYRTREWLDEIPPGPARDMIRDQLDQAQEYVRLEVARAEAEARDSVSQVLAPLIEGLHRSPDGSDDQSIEEMCTELGVPDLKPEIREYLRVVGRDEEFAGLIFPSGPVTVAGILDGRSQIESAAQAVGAVYDAWSVPLPGLGDRGGWATLHGDVWQIIEDDYEFCGTFIDVLREGVRGALERIDD